MKFLIRSKSGVDYGLWDGATPTQAWVRMVGYNTFNCAGILEGWAVLLEADKEEAPQMKGYDVTLVNARGVSTADIEAAEKIFRESLEAAYGGWWAVKEAFLAATAICDEVIIDRCDDLISEPERRIVASWFAAMCLAEKLAFEGWHNSERAHFEVSV